MNKVLSGGVDYMNGKLEKDLMLIRSCVKRFLNRM